MPHFEALPHRNSQLTAQCYQLLVSSIASTQTKATEETERRVKQLLDYLATLPNAKARAYVSKMVLNVHSDASYLSEPGAKSRRRTTRWKTDIIEW